MVWGGIYEADIFPTITTRTGSADIDLIVEEYGIPIPTIPKRTE